MYLIRAETAVILLSASKYESLNSYFWYQSGFDILDGESIAIHLSEVWDMFFRAVRW